MTQSRIPSGKNPSKRDNMIATPVWICAEDFLARPRNISGLCRVELARTKDCGEHLLVIYHEETKTFCDANTGKQYGPSGLEIKIVDVK